MPPKIAYVVTEDWYFTGHHLHVARAARDAGFEIHVLTRLDSCKGDIEREAFVPHPLSWRRGSLSPLSAAAAAIEIRRILKQIGPSIVHNLAIKPAILGSLACTGLKSTGVVNSITGLGFVFLRSSIRWRIAQAILNRAFALLFKGERTQVVVQNPDDRAALEGAGVGPEYIMVIPGCGVDTEVLQPLPEPPLPIRVAFAGRMLEDKGVRHIIEAHSLLHQKGMHIHLLLAGLPDPENPTSIPWSDIKKWARMPGVYWLGQVADIRTVWAESHIAVLASRREGLPQALLEAAAMGRPLVATDAPGCREIVRHGETGLLVPVNAVTPLAHAIATLANDAEMRHRMGAAARALTETRFSAIDIGRQTIEVYRSLLEKL